jgi:diazepam-binding inhibitor (GABA receptor modulator, acyl-CoA-binding protein)
MDELKNNFEKALEDVKKTNPSQEKKLKLYGLFKQINFGDNNESKPWSYQIEKSYKWQAWKDNQGKSKEECMKLYIDLVKQIKL